MHGSVFLEMCGGIGCSAVSVPHPLSTAIYFQEDSHNEFKSLRPDSMELPLSVPEEEEEQEEEDLFDGTVTSPVAFRLSMRMSQPVKSPEDMLAEITDLKRLLYSATTEERRAAIRTSIDALERALDPVGRMDDEVGGSKWS